MDRLHAMEVFVRVVESGSFTAAGRALGMGQPAVSKTIAALEEQLGTALLLRSARQMIATEAGEHFYARAKALVEEADDAWTSARGEANALSGHLRVCAPVTFARLNIVPHIAGFLALHPQLQLDMILDDRAIDLIEANIDVALRMGDLGDSSLIARKLGSAERMVVASPTYLAARGTPVVPADLAAHDAVLYTQPVSADEWRFRQGTAESSVRLSSRFSTTAAEGLREAVLAGCGVAIVSQWMMGRELAEGNVIRLLPDWHLPPVSLWAVFPGGRRVGARTRAFMEWFERQIVEKF